MSEPCPNCGEPACSNECSCSDEDKELAALEHCPGVDHTDRRTGVTQHHNCAWGELSDWEGDPSIPNGTHNWKFAKCASCSMEIQRPYPDWLRRKLEALMDSEF